MDCLSKTETTRKMWDLAQANPERLYYAGEGRLWHRPDGGSHDAPGLFVELRVERYSHKAKDPRLALVAHALIRDGDGQISDVEATTMARSDFRPTFTREQVESAAGRMQSWAAHIAAEPAAAFA